MKDTYLAEKSSLLAATGVLILGLSLADSSWGGLALGGGFAVVGVGLSFWSLPGRSLGRKSLWSGIYVGVMGIGLLVIAVAEATGALVIGFALAAAFVVPWFASRLAPEDLESHP